jgi:hypothetical protein
MPRIYYRKVRIVERQAQRRHRANSFPLGQRLNGIGFDRTILIAHLMEGLESP